MHVSRESHNVLEVMIYFSGGYIGYLGYNVSGTLSYTQFLRDDVS